MRTGLSILCLSLVLGGCQCGGDVTPTAVEAPGAAAPDEPAHAEPTPPPPGAAAPRLVPGATLTFPGTEEPANVTSVALSADGTTLLATGWGKRVVVFDLATGVGRELAQIDAGDLFEASSALAFADGFAVGTFGFTYVWDSELALVSRVDGRTSSLAAVGETLYRVNRELLERLTADGQVQGRAELAGLTSVVSAEGRLFAYVRGSSDELVELDPSTLDELSRAPAGGAAFMGQGPFASVAGGISFYEWQQRLAEVSLEGLAWDFRSADAAGALAVGLGNGHGVSLLDPRSGAVLASVDLPTAECIILDGGDRVFFGAPDGVGVLTIEHAPQ